MAEFVRARNELRGKRAACVAGIIRQLLDGEIHKWTDLCDAVGMDHHGQLMPAMHALEMVGAVERYVYTDGEGTRGKPAFQIAEGIELVGGDDE